MERQLVSSQRPHQLRSVGAHSICSTLSSALCIVSLLTRVCCVYMLQRTALSDDDIREEVSALERQGHRRLLVLTGEHPKYTFDQFLHVSGLKSRLQQTETSSGILLYSSGVVVGGRDVCTVCCSDVHLVCGATDSVAGEAAATRQQLCSAGLGCSTLCQRKQRPWWSAMEG
jgi:hypothetical protein